jgi:hypothetical protein
MSADVLGAARRFTPAPSVLATTTIAPGPIVPGAGTVGVGVSGGGTVVMTIGPAGVVSTVGVGPVRTVGRLPTSGVGWLSLPFAMRLLIQNQASPSIKITPRTGAAIRR